MDILWFFSGLLWDGAMFDFFSNFFSFYSVGVFPLICDTIKINFTLPLALKMFFVVELKHSFTKCYVAGTMLRVSVR